MRDRVALSLDKPLENYAMSVAVKGEFKGREKLNINIVRKTVTTRLIISERLRQG